MTKPTRLFIVDDSPYSRSVLRNIFARAADIALVGAAGVGTELASQLTAAHPEVVVWGDGPTALADEAVLTQLLLAADRPRVVLMTEPQPAHFMAALTCLEAGAIDVFARPPLTIYSPVEAVMAAIQQTIRAAAEARFPPPWSPPLLAWPNGVPAVDVVGLAAGGGGPALLKALLRALPPEMPGCVITQMLPPGLSAEVLAAWLSQSSRLMVCAAQDGDAIEPGLVLIAPADKQVTVERQGATYRVRATAAWPAAERRMSANALLGSIATAAGDRGVGAILTGAGSDGAEGLAALRAAGGHTLAQDQTTSQLFEMPRGAIEHDAAEMVVAAESIAPQLCRWSAGWE